MKKTIYSNDDISALCTELVYLLHAGIGNADALNMLTEDETRAEFKADLKKMAERADEGAMLSEIFEENKNIPNFVSRMLAVGERTGRIEEALTALANTCGRRAELERSLKSALLYPSVLLLIMLAVIAILLIYVMPVFSEVYGQLGGSLTGVAGGLLSLGKALGKGLPILIALFCLAVLFLTAFSAVPAFRAAVLKRWRTRRGDRGVAGKTASATFAQALALAMSSGMGVEEAVAGATELVADNTCFREKAEACLQKLREGTTTAEALKSTGLLPAAQCRILEAGIQGGSGEKAMESIAERLTEESEAEMESAISRVEPAMVIITSVLVGLILLSVMLPLINIMSAIG